MNSINHAVYEVFTADDDRTTGEAGAVGIYTGIGVSDSEDPDIVIDFGWLLDNELEEDRAYPSDLRVGLPGHPEVFPALQAVLTELAVLTDAEGVDALAAFIAWCHAEMQPKTEATMAAIGYL